MQMGMYQDDTFPFLYGAKITALAFICNMEERFQ